MYDDINDYELLDMVCDNEMATEALYEKYKPMIISIANKTYRSSKLPGIDPNDLIQEGMIGLSIAINTFNDNREASFYTFARLCIIRRIISSLISYKRQKNQILNNSVSVEKIAEYSLEDILVDNKNNPENLLISGENTKELMNKIEKELTSFETEVFELKMVGFTIGEISELLDKSKKSISNALDRIRIKINRIKN
ncbi:MAG: sigma-70 family RNA polymerase sigma factor [Bacilli bacterium]|nr:sigma-70 family RNA polymerase sigma factor [Bacilli bacterium]